MTTEYEQAYKEFFVEKKWLKANLKLLEEYYGNQELEVPCDGYVQTKRDAIKAVRYYKAFYDKTKQEGKLTKEAETGINRTIKKYENWKE